MKWYAAALAAAFVLLQYRLWFSADGVGESLRLKQAVAQQRAANEQLSARNRQLAEEVRDLKQGLSALEERARTDLGMVGPNETFYQVRSTEPVRAAGGQAPAAMPANTTAGQPAGASFPGAAAGAPAPQAGRLPASPAEGDALTHARPR